MLAEQLANWKKISPVSFAAVVHVELLVAAASLSRRITEIGLLLGFVGALIGLAFMLQLLALADVFKTKPSPGPSFSPGFTTESPTELLSPSP